MGKDPAYLYYFKDMMAATFTWTDAEVGAYQRALNCQADQGHLLLDDLRKVLNDHWDRISPKFDKDRMGKFYNKRLEEVLLERASFCDSRRINALRRKHKQSTSKARGTATDMHMEDAIEDADANGNRDADSPYECFKKTYPLNGSALNPEVETWFFQAPGVGIEVDIVIAAATDYAEYCKAKYKGYPDSSYIKQAINWLKQKQYVVNWKARFEADKPEDKSIPEMLADMKAQGKM